MGVFTRVCEFGVGLVGKISQLLCCKLQLNSQKYQNGKSLTLRVFHCRKNTLCEAFCLLCNIKHSSEG